MILVNEKWVKYHDHVFSWVEDYRLCYLFSDYTLMPGVEQLVKYKFIDQRILDSGGYLVVDVVDRMVDFHAADDLRNYFWKSDD